MLAACTHWLLYHRYQLHCKEALNTIPQQSELYKCIADVLNGIVNILLTGTRHGLNCKKWSSETGCPDSVFNAFNIDVKINSAYVVLGLLYGNGDFTKTLEIATRAGQDADCNPSTAGGILGAMIGYEKVPEMHSVFLFQCPLKILPAE